MSKITLDGIVKKYGAVTAVHGIDLEINDGEFVVLVGPSGCGKSTTLRMIAGLEAISGGTMRIGGDIVNDMEPKQRNIAMVFQNYAIYPHMTVRQNISFGLYTSPMSKADKAARVDEIGQVLGLTHLLERRPAALSGGQRQRVAIGRAMVRNPRAFLFDEPLSNLDAQLRAQMRLEIKQLHQRLKKTIVFVTHDQVEAMSLADRIVIMRDGRILQVGTPLELYNKPVDMFTARFIGTPEMNMIDARQTGSGLGFGANGDNIAVAADMLPPALVEAGQDLALGLRPQNLVPAAELTGPVAMTVTGTVRVVEPQGSETFVYLDLKEGSVIARAPSRMTFTPGETAEFAAGQDTLRFFDRKSEALVA
jgi:multiple sugar transport system ATP-binding protein